MNNLIRTISKSFKWIGGARYRYRESSRVYPNLSDSTESQSFNVIMTVCIFIVLIIACVIVRNDNIKSEIVEDN